MRGFPATTIHWIFLKGLKMFDFEIASPTSKIHLITLSYSLIISAVSTDVVCNYAKRVHKRYTRYCIYLILTLPGNPNKRCVYAT